MQIIEAFAEANDIDLDQLLWTLAFNNATIEDVEVTN